MLGESCPGDTVLISVFEHMSKEGDSSWKEIRNLSRENLHHQLHLIHQVLRYIKRCDSIYVRAICSDEEIKLSIQSKNKVSCHLFATHGPFQNIVMKFFLVYEQLYIMFFEVVCN